MGRTTKTDAALKKGSAEMLVLSLLEERPRHGYEIAKLIQQRSNGVLTFHAASLYPLLYRMEGRRLIQGRWVEQAGTAPAPLRITPGGAAFLPSAGRAGPRSSTRWCGSRGCAMPDWPAFVREQLAGRRAVSDQTIEELAHHVEET